MIILVCPNSSTRWTVHGKKCVHSSTSKIISLSVVWIRPWGGRSMFKNPSTRPPQNYNLGPASKSVHEVDGACSKIRPLVHLKIIISVRCPNLSMRWTVWAKISVRCPHGRMDGWTVRGRLSASEEAWLVLKIILNLGNKYGMFDRQSQCNIQQRSATVNHDIDTKVWINF